MARCENCTVLWSSLWETLSKLCDYEEEEPGHARLQRMIEDREREEATAQEQSWQLALEEERCVREWQAELLALAKQREHMDAEELQQDLLAHFACADVLLRSEQPAEEELLSRRRSKRMASLEREPSRVKALVLPPKSAVESWLEGVFPRGGSFGELPGAALAALPAAFEAALAKDAEKAAAEAESAPEDEIGEAFERLLAKYEEEALVTKAASQSGKAKAARWRELERKVAALRPCVERDAAGTRALLALASLEVDEERALSTADVCWALCCEKKKALAEALLAEKDSWEELRRTGVGWWMGREALDALVTRLAQGAAARVKEDASSADEAFFWYVLTGARLQSLQALARTRLAVEPALGKLLAHPRSGEEAFLRKNGFRLLQLHRFHLAAALFWLGGGREEAARVVAGHLRDMQLAMVLARQQPAVKAALVRERLADSPLAGRDPWLRLLLAAHGEDTGALRELLKEAPTAPGSWEPLQLFDGCLGLSVGREGLWEAGGLLLRA